jgi:hypothetical protein
MSKDTLSNTESLNTKLQTNQFNKTEHEGLTLRLLTALINLLVCSGYYLGHP